MEIKDLKPGDFFRIEYGYSYRLFYVIANVNKHIIATRQSWCVSSHISFSDAELEKRLFFYIGKGKYRWWRKFLPGFRDLISIYSLPKGIEG
jgi:hypothetical protein